MNACLIGAWVSFTRTMLAGLLSACIGACGGGDSFSDGEHAEGIAESFSALLNDDGTSMPSMPQTVPVDVAAHTKQGRYASARQAEQLEHALGNGVIRVNVECCGSEGVDQAVGMAHGMRAAGDLLYSTPVLVRAADLRLGAMSADRLWDAGYGSVWLVTR